MKNKSPIEIQKLEPLPNSSTKADVTTSSRYCSKPLVGSSAVELSSQIVHITAQKPLSNDMINMLNKIVEKVNKLKL